MTSGFQLSHEHPPYYSAHTNTYTHNFVAYAYLACSGFDLVLPSELEKFVMVQFQQNTENILKN